MRHPMRLAIRDDDTSYFTSPEQLERAWNGLIGQIPISLAVTPNALEPFHLGDADRYYQSSESRALRDNPDLVTWLRGQISSGNISVLCHGYTHEYKRVSSRRLLPEYVWKPYPRLANETALAKRHLESALGTKVEIFVPPSNAVSRAGLEALRPHFPNVNATVPLRRLADIRMDSISAYMRRFWYQASYGSPNPHAEQIAGVNLLPSFSLSRGASWKSLLERLECCSELGADLIVAVHYWEMDEALRDCLKRLVEYATRSGSQFVHCRSLFQDAAARGPAKWKENRWADSRIS